MSSSQLVLLVGHCGPDTSYLRMAVQKAIPEAMIRSAHDDHDISKQLAASPGDAPQPILLINRALEPGFESETGVELVEKIHRKHPLAKLILVSNYADAQEAAVKNGALPGFGKRDIGSPKLTTLLREAAAKLAEPAK